MMNWWKKSLAVQLLTSIMLTLFASQAIGLAVSCHEYLGALRMTARTELQSRAAAVARLIEVAPGSLQSDVARVNSTEYTRFWISREQPVSLDGWLADAFKSFHVPLSDLLNASGVGMLEGSHNASTPLSPDASIDYLRGGSAWTAPVAGGADFRQGTRYLDYAEGNGAGVIVPLNDGRVLNVALYKDILPSVWAMQLPITLALTACLVSLVGVLTIRRVVRPLQQLSRAAETLGRGERVEPLDEYGTHDIRRTAEAFNQMQERLHRFVDDRTRMLGAIGHDLRTPLTTLRLRTELVADPELQERMLSTIDEMQAMTEATLSLSRQETVLEPTRTIDLAALVESICEDLSELGHSVAFAASSRITYRCRPDGLRRTVRNLIENSVRYAGHAEVRLVASTSAVEIVVEDDGPGIPADKAEEVFAPFFRIESSRSRETGGVGLGLSIARAIARQHGGDIVFSARQPGLKASVMLPA